MYFNGLLLLLINLIKKFEKSKFVNFITFIDSLFHTGSKLMGVFISEGSQLDSRFC